MGKHNTEACSHCHRPFSADHKRAIRQKRANNMLRSRAIAEANGSYMGKPRTVDYIKICEMHQKGFFTIADLAKKFKVCRATIYRALATGNR